MDETIMYTKLKRNRIGGINGILESGIESTLSPEECKLAEAGEWGVIAEYTQAEKDAYALEQENAAIMAELATLDATPRLLEEAALGDEYAINKLMELKERKNALRASLK